MNRFYFSPLDSEVLVNWGGFFKPFKCCSSALKTRKFLFYHVSQAFMLLLQKLGL